MPPADRRDPNGAPAVSLLDRIRRQRDRLGTNSAAMPATQAEALREAGENAIALRLRAMPPAKPARRPSRAKVKALRERQQAQPYRPRSSSGGPRDMSSILRDLVRVSAPWQKRIDWDRFAELEREMDAAVEAGER